MANQSILAAFERMWTHVIAKLGDKADVEHEHDDIYYTKTEVDTSLSNKANSSHSHDDRYYTESEVDTKLATKSDTTHNHDSDYDANGSAADVQSNLDVVSDTLNAHTSNNDIHFTSTERTKLTGIETGAQKNTITGVKGDGESTYRTGNVNITPANIGLGNVNNTADSDKPVSTAQQLAIDESLDEAKSYTNTSLSSYYTKTQIDNAGYITSDDITAITTAEIDEICVVPVICTMTIAGTSYNFEEGMTWAEWVDSSYNTDGYVNSGNRIKPANSSLVVNNDEGDSAILPSYIIESNHQYYINYDSPV